jgi:hypothetical protein
LAFGVAAYCSSLECHWLRNNGVGQPFCEALGLAQKLGKRFALQHD